MWPLVSLEEVLAPHAEIEWKMPSFSWLKSIVHSAVFIIKFKAQHQILQLKLVILIKKHDEALSSRFPISENKTHNWSLKFRM